MQNRQYPIGQFEFDENYIIENKAAIIDYFENFPTFVENEIENLKEDELEQIYRENGWSIRQLVHHLADSHINMYLRVKFAITEENPTIKGYDEALWATLPDNSLDLSYSVSILKGVHKRLAQLYKTLSEEDFKKGYFHSGYQRTFTLNEVLGLYDWHSKHHLEQIKIAKQTPWKK